MKTGGLGDEMREDPREDCLDRRSCSFFSSLSGSNFGRENIEACARFSNSGMLRSIVRIEH